MMGGALGYRVPPENWKPADWNPDSANKPLITAHQVHLNVACRTPQFWLLWSVLMLNVSAGIGILSMASPLLQEVFAGRLIGVTAAYDQLTPGQLASIAAIAAGFTGLLSLFNILGAFSGLAVRSHRTQSHLHGVLRAGNPALFGHPLDRDGRVPRTVRAVRLHHPVDVWRRLRHDPGLSLGPLRHKNGGRHTRAAADRLVDRGVLGPLLIGYLRQYQLDHGVQKAQVYSFTMYVLAALLALGFLRNLLVRPVAAKKLHDQAQLAQLDAEQHLVTRPATAAVAGDGTPSPGWLVTAAWLAVSIPIAWGVLVALQKAVILFGL